MPHVWNQSVWTKGVFQGARKEPASKPTELILELADGTERVMNLNWKGAALTERKVSALRPGASIRIASWAGWSASEWFCDVEEIR
jgi:hypothetical protein